MEDNVYIPRDVRFSENILWSLDLWGTVWFAVIALISLSILRYLWAWFGVYGFGVIAFIDAFTYMYHSEYPGATHCAQGMCYARYLHSLLTSD